MTANALLRLKNRNSLFLSSQRAMKGLVPLVALCSLISCGQRYYTVAPYKPKFQEYASDPTPQTTATPPEQTAAGPPDETTRSLEASVPKSNDSPIEKGKALYLERCASCHLPIENSNRRGLKAGRIDDAYTKKFPTHENVVWPTRDEAYDLEAALAIP